jgi:hypothetical protein
MGTLIQIPVESVIVIAVSLYMRGEKESALELAGHIIGSYDNINKMKTDIFNSFIKAGPAPLSNSLIFRMKKQFPNECEALVEMFGKVLLGD